MRAATAALEMNLFDFAKVHLMVLCACPIRDAITNEALMLLISISTKENEFEAKKIQFCQDRAELLANFTEEQRETYVSLFTDYSFMNPVIRRDGPGGPRDPAIAMPFLNRLLRQDSQIEIRHDAKRGFGIFAKKNLPEGEIILLDQPIISCNIDPKRCHYCTKSCGSSPIPCPNAKCKIQFCSVACRDQANFYHKPLCGLDTSSLDDFVGRGCSSSALVWLLAWRMLGASMSVIGAGEYVAKRPADLPLFNVMFRTSDSGEDEETRLNNLYCWCYMREPFRSQNPCHPALRDPLLDLQWILDVGSMLRPNSISIDTPGATSRLYDGATLLMAGNYFQHSCEPNTS